MDNKDFYFTWCNETKRFIGTHKPLMGYKTITFQQWLKKGEKEMTEIKVGKIIEEWCKNNSKNYTHNALFINLEHNIIKHINDDLLNTEPQEINLETHMGKVNDDRLYEFSNDEGWKSGISGSWLCFVNQNHEKRYRAMFSDGSTEKYKYCRLHKEPEQKEYMSIPEMQWFMACMQKQNTFVMKRKEDKTWTFNYELDDQLSVDSYEWTTIDDKTKSYGEAYEFTKNYLK